MARLQRGVTWIAVIRDQCVGTVAGHAINDEWRVRSMAVLPSCQGQGAGQLLLQSVEEYARAAGFRSLTLSTTPFLHQAIRLYEKMGFKFQKEGPHQLFGTPLLRMRKVLT